MASSVHRPIADVPPFAFPPQCQRYPGTGGRCTDRAEWWVVSPDGLAITTYCDAHAGAVQAEYDRAAVVATDLELRAAVSGWTLAPVEVLP